MSTPNVDDDAASTQKITPPIVSAMLSVFALIIGIVLVCISTLLSVGNPEPSWRAGLYFIGAAAILAAYAYVDGVSMDKGKKDA